MGIHLLTHTNANKHTHTHTLEHTHPYKHTHTYIQPLPQTYILSHKHKHTTWLLYFGCLFGCLFWLFVLVVCFCCLFSFISAVTISSILALFQLYPKLDLNINIIFPSTNPKALSQLVYNPNLKYIRFIYKPNSKLYLNLVSE